MQDHRALAGPVGSVVEKLAIMRVHDYVNMAVSQTVAWLTKRWFIGFSMAALAVELNAEFPSQNQISAWVSKSSFIPCIP